MESLFVLRIGCLPPALDRRPRLLTATAWGAEIAQYFIDEASSLIKGVNMKSAFAAQVEVALCHEFNISVVEMSMGDFNRDLLFPLTHSWRPLRSALQDCGGRDAILLECQKRMKSAEIRIMRFKSQSDEAENRCRVGNSIK